MKILVTGAAGFIGAHLTEALLRKAGGVEITGLDSLDSCYDVNLKEYRLKRIAALAGEIDAGWRFIKGDITDASVVSDVFRQTSPDIVVNLAAQAGVRRSISDPEPYIGTNITGFYNILEACRHSYDGGRNGVRHLLYASSSSVYGENPAVPYRTSDRTDFPVSLYAATKKCDEILAYSYAGLYGIPSTGIRFFTVYGPAGRPDMAYFRFTDQLVKGRKINLYNYGKCVRDFTYIDDIVEGLMRVIPASPEWARGENGQKIPPYRLYNLGNGHPASLADFVKILQEELSAAGVLPEGYDIGERIEMLPMQSGDVTVSYSDISAFEADFGFRPETSLRTGLRRFAEWYKEYYFGKRI